MKAIWYVFVGFCCFVLGFLLGEVLMNIYHSRKNHKLGEWRRFCEWVETLPYMRELLGLTA